MMSIGGVCFGVFLVVSGHREEKEGEPANEKEDTGAQTGAQWADKAVRAQALPASKCDTRASTTAIVDCFSSL